MAAGLRRGAREMSEVGAEVTKLTQSAKTRLGRAGRCMMGGGWGGRAGRKLGDAGND